MSPEFFQALKKRETFRAYLVEHKISCRQRGDNQEFQIDDDYWLATYHPNGRFKELIWI